MSVIIKSGNSSDLASVKPASTAPIATDPSLVVTISPNSPAQSITVTNFPSVQAVSGTLSISNFPSSQAVTGTFFQSIQPISGSVSVSNFPGTQPISGSVSVSNFPASQAVTGTFFQATQPVSAVSLPLPSGASTEATLALIKAKTDNLDVLLSTRTKPADAQNITGSVSVTNFPATQPISGTVAVSGTVPVSGTFFQATQPVSGTVAINNFPATQAVTGTFFQATQPVSGTVTANAGSGTFTVSGPLTDTQLRASAVPVSGTFFQATQPISGTVTANQGGSWTVTANAGTNLNTSALALDATLAKLTVAQGATLDANTQVMMGGSVATSAPTYVTGQISPLSLTVAGGLRIDGSATTQPVSGSVSVSNFPAIQTVTQAAGSSIIATQTTAANLNATVTQQVIAKGTQGTTGVTTQDLKDAGRVIRVFNAAFTAATTEAMVNLTPITDGTAGSTGTSFIVTAGKRLRLQTLMLTCFNATAAIHACQVNLRMSATGAVTTSSPIVGTVATTTAAATANLTSSQAQAIPDGLELSGTMQLGISQIGIALAGQTVVLVGYEY